MKLATPPGATSALLLLFAVGFFFPAVSPRVFAIAPENVLVIYNDDPGTSGDGYKIADYYRQVRPGVNIAPISGVDAILTGPYNEEVGGQDYLDVIRPQILSAIAASPNPEAIEVIVTTKGLPLRINSGSNSFSSLESELARIDSIDTLGKMTNQFFLAGFHQFDNNLSSNPYYFDNAPFVRTGSDPVNGDIRLSARLDGYSVSTVKDTIDRAQDVYLVPFGQNIILDDTSFPSVDQMTNSAGLGPGLSEVITGLYPDDGATNPVPMVHDMTSAAITSSSRPVLGYVSHGTNDGAGGLETGYILNQFDFEFANGAVFLTHESFNAISFDPAYSQTQGLIAEWLEIGGTAGLGHVQEPNNGPDNVTNEDLFYQMFLPPMGASAAPGESGATFVEAAWNATRQLSYVNTVVGDPLMTIQAWLPGDTNLDGEVEFNDFFTLDGNWLQPGSFKDGDFNGDGMVDGSDFSILQANWLTSVGGVLASSTVDIMVYPMLDAMTGEPVLNATLLEPANVNSDLNVDGNDLDVLTAAFGINDSGDVSGDGDTDGADFLLWQQQFYVYSLNADFDIDGVVQKDDFDIWVNSFGNNRGGDTDQDDDTDGSDFLAWQREYSSPPSSLGSASAVPEPATHTMVVAAALVLMRSRRLSGRRTDSYLWATT